MKVEEELLKKRKLISNEGQDRWMGVRIIQVHASTWIKMPFWKLSLCVINMPYKIAKIKKKVKTNQLVKSSSFWHYNCWRLDFSNILNIFFNFQIFYNEHNTDYYYYLSLLLLSPTQKHYLKFILKAVTSNFHLLYFILLGLNVLFIKHCPSRQTKTSDYFFFNYPFHFICNILFLPNFHCKNSHIQLCYGLNWPLWAGLGT